MANQKSIYYLRYAAGMAVLALPVCGLLAGQASAQCTANAPLGFQNIAPEPGNPFQAEYSVNVTSPIPAPDTAGSVVRSAARDGRGRVRVEHSRGKYQIQRSDGTQATEERITVFICDPATGTSVHLDTLNKTATIRKLSDSPAPGTPASATTGGQSFCARMFEFRTRNHDVQTKELGKQQISGFDAHGMRFWSPLRTDFDATPSFTYTDTWCSEELGAVVGLVVVSANGDHRRETMLKKVTRKEPDPSLFQVPAGYTRLEREAAPRSNLN